MKRIFLLLLLPIALLSCRKEEPKTFEYVTAQFLEHSAAIQKVAYEVQRIDTFARGGTVWNHTGKVLLEKDPTDSLFGFSFYAKRDDFPKEHLYDKGKAFEISEETRSFELEKGHFGFLGKPGGQMVSHDLFQLDSVYTKAELIEQKDRYVLRYEFEDDTTYHVTRRVKTVELDKITFFPLRITRTSEQLGNRSVNLKLFSNFRFNEEVQNSIAGYKERISDYDVIEPGRHLPSSILQDPLPGVSLLNLLDETEMVSLEPGKLTLLDFWEVWCSPCIKSFPEVEKIKNKFPERLQVVGIVSENKAAAQKLISRKGISFLNLVGTREFLNKFDVNSFPRYFLIDRKGIVQKEYFGFSEQIEKDITAMLGKS